MPSCFSLPGGEERGGRSLKRGKDKPPQQSGRATWSADGDQGRCRGGHSLLTTGPRRAEALSCPWLEGEVSIGDSPVSLIGGEGLS